MKYKIIGTGSKGNALLLGNKMLIDCGVSYKKLKDEDIQLVLLTHEHGDHFNQSTIRLLNENHPMIRWCCPPYLVRKLYYDCGVPLAHVDVADPRDISLSYNDFRVKPFELIHDVPNTGYIIVMSTGEKVMYVTDTGTVDHFSHFGPCDYYFIEANYREAELKETISQKLAAGAFSYETRVADTHLSEEQAIRFISENARPESKVIYMHKHIEKEDEINDNYTYRETVSASE